MPSIHHPWIPTETQIENESTPITPELRGFLRPTEPQPGVPEPDMLDRLRQKLVQRAAPLWWLGVHGGAGESTLEALIPDSRAAGHAWPIMDDGSVSSVILVARANSNGLRAAQRAATEWASGTLPTIRLLSLVIVADAPGKLPKPLRDLAQVVSGGVPEVWHVPWVEAWRLGEPASPGSAPKEVRALAAAARALIAPTA